MKKSQMRELDEKINEESSKVIAEAQTLQTWLSTRVGQKANEAKILSWSDQAVFQIGEVISRDHEIIINDLVQDRLNELQHQSDEEKTDIRLMTGAKREHVRRDLGAQLDELRQGVEEKKDRIRSSYGARPGRTQDAGRANVVDREPLSRTCRQVGQCLHGRHGCRSRARYCGEGGLGQADQGTAPRDSHNPQQAAPQEGCQASARGGEFPQERFPSDGNHADRIALSG